MVRESRLPFMTRKKTKPSSVKRQTNIKGTAKEAENRTDFITTNKQDKVLYSSPASKIQ